LISLWLRAFAYAALAALVAQFAFLEAQHFEGLDQFSELGYVELGQTVLLGVAVLMTAVAAWRSSAPEPLLVCLALGFAILFVRENDQVLELWLPHGIWKWPAGALFVALAAVFLRRRRLVMDQLLALSRLPAFGVFLAGFATLVFSRLFGRGDFWEAIMGERYWRPVKNAAEEGTELFALALLTAGVVELLLARRGGRRE
jgi:hypothetical protein